jgi:hypothetical protein
MLIGAKLAILNLWPTCIADIVVGILVGVDRISGETGSVSSKLAMNVVLRGRVKSYSILGGFRRVPDRRPSPTVRCRGLTCCRVGVRHVVRP